MSWVPTFYNIWLHASPIKVTTYYISYTIIIVVIINNVLFCYILYKNKYGSLYLLTTIATCLRNIKLHYFIAELVSIIQEARTSITTAVRPAAGARRKRAGRLMCDTSIDSPNMTPSSGSTFNSVVTEVRADPARGTRRAGRRRRAYNCTESHVE
uniref:Uncharacterized protein n=1 Tax=Pectinophora gossypiella TaxID=13191 RepID=A0A1E1WMH6_PECGO